MAWNATSTSFGRQASRVTSPAAAMNKSDRKIFGATPSPSAGGLFASVGPKDAEDDYLGLEFKPAKPPPPNSYNEDGHRIVPPEAGPIMFAQRRVDLCASLLPQAMSGGGPDATRAPRLSGDPAFLWSVENWQRGRGERFNATIHELPMSSSLQKQFAYAVPSAAPPPGSPRRSSLCSPSPSKSASPGHSPGPSPGHSRSLSPVPAVSADPLAITAADWGPSSDGGLSVGLGERSPLMLSLIHI